MSDNHANAISVPTGAVPRQEWRKLLPWPNAVLRATPQKVITDGDELSRTVTSLLCGAQHEWMAVRPGHFPIQTLTVEPVPLWPVPDTDHVRARAVYDSSYTTGTLERTLVRMHAALGEEARVCRGVAARMLIADKTALVIVPPGTGLLISDPADVRQCRVHFEGLWEKSLPFGRPELSAPEEQVLVLLAQGRDISQIAADTGISKRSVVEYAQDISRRLGAGNMLQAGVLASMRGWVD